MKRLIAASIIWSCLCVTVQADFTINPNFSTGSTFSDVNFSTHPLINLRNQSGFLDLPGDAYQPGVTDFSEAMAKEHFANGDGGWFGNFPTFNGSQLPGRIEYDLGAIHQLTGVGLWSLQTNGVKDFSVQVGDDVSFTNITTVGSYSMIDVTNAITTGQGFSFGSTAARYVRLTISSAQNDGSSVGIGEIAFSAIPEPNSILAFLLLGSMSIIRRRR